MDDDISYGGEMERKILEQEGGATIHRKICPSFLFDFLLLHRTSFRHERNKWSTFGSHDIFIWFTWQTFHSRFASTLTCMVPHSSRKHKKKGNIIYVHARVVSTTATAYCFRLCRSLPLEGMRSHNALRRRPVPRGQECARCGGVGTEILQSC